MRNKKRFQLNASFTLVLLVMLGYSVKFFPENLFVFDHPFQEVIRNHMTDHMTLFYRGITNFGGIHYVVFILVISLFFFVLKKWYVEAIFLILNVVISPIMVTVLKLVYNRQRPDFHHLVVENGLSFPSGHACIGILLYGTLLIIFLQRISKHIIKYSLILLGLLLILLIGISRVYLGVHYPSDILGGWLLGGSWLLFWFPVYDEFRFKWRFTGVQK